MKKYEILLILPGTLDEAEAAEKIADAKAVLEEFAEDVSLHEMGKNRLAYPIKHIRYGYFYLADFSAEEAQVNQIQDKLILSRELLRAIITLADKNATAEQKITYFGDGRFKREVPETQEKEGREKRPAMREEKVVSESNNEEAPAKSDEPEVEAKSIPEDVKPEEETVKVEEAPKKKTVDLKEIDKKLDEILSDDNIMSGV